jgi:hypothetical protein
VPALEKRVSDLEVKVTQLQHDRTIIASPRAERDAEFNSCVTEANDNYAVNLRANSKERGENTLSISEHVSQKLDGVKRSMLEECKLLYR